MITFVWAEDEKHQIGIDGHLPWRLPADLHHFKKITYINILKIEKFDSIIYFIIDIF